MSQSQRMFEVKKMVLDPFFEYCIGQKSSHASVPWVAERQGWAEVAGRGDTMLSFRGTAQ